MRNKYKNIYKVVKSISGTVSPELIASEYMKWKRDKLGKKVVYFANNRRNQSRNWKYFDILSEKFQKWERVMGRKIDLWYYFDRHLEKVGKGEFLYANMLVTEFSHRLYFSEGDFDPAGIIESELPDFTDIKVYDKYIEWKKLDRMEFVLDWQEASWADKYNQRR